MRTSSTRRAISNAIRESPRRPSHHALIRLTQNTVFPDSPQVERVVDIFHRIPFHQHQISFQSCPDLSAVREVESLCVQVGTVKARCNDLNGEGVFNRYNEVIVTTDVGLSNHVPPLY
jgi:hypothetical protein